MRTLRSSRILGLTIPELIGGRWAISLLAYAINAPLNITLTLFGSVGSQPGAWVPLLVLSVLGYLAFGLVALLADITVFRHRRSSPVPVAAVVLLGAIAGLVRGLVIGIGAQAYVEESVPFTASRIVTSTLLGAVLVPGLALMLAIVDQYRTQRRTLLASAMELRAEAMREDGASEAMRAAMLASVRDDLDEVARTGDPARARAIGHQFWQSSEPARQPHLSWRAVIRSSVTHSPFPTVAVAGIWSLSAIGTLTAVIGPGRASMQVMLSVAVITVMFAVGRRWAAAGGGALAFIVVMGVVVVVTGPVASLLVDPRPWPAGAGLVVANAIWLPLLTVVAGVVIAAVRASEQVLQDLADEVSDGAIAVMAAHEERVRLGRELGAHLHGTVQSRLLAAAATTGDTALRETAAAAIEWAVSASGPDRRSLRARLEEVTQTWGALMAVSLTIPDGVEVDRMETVDAVTRIVEEGMANAYRHGRASAADVLLSQEADDVVIVVESNGTLREGAEASGMGSALFTALSRGRWSLMALTPVGTRLHVRVG